MTSSTSTHAYPLQALNLKEAFSRMTKLFSLALAATLSLAPSACSSRDSNPLAPTIEATSFAPALGVNLASSTRTSTGLYYRDLTTGTGAVTARGMSLSVRYAGSLANGTQFDASAAAGPPFTFNLGASEVIAGWDEGLVGMRVGGRRQLIIPPALGYGARGSGPIPGNAILVFTVEVVSAR